MKAYLRPTGVEHEPPRITCDSCDADVRSDNHVPEEQPLADQRFPAVTRRHAHDAVVRRVEAERGRRQTVCYQVDPKQLHRNQSFRHAKKHSQEDATDRKL